ncbi:MAG: toxin-antitoxin system HicB family antitoxin [Gaiellaceae bacterium]
MQIEGHVQALRDDLGAVAALGDESTARAAHLLAVALDSAFGRRLLEALNEASLELSDQLDGARVELRISGNEPQLVIVDEAAPAADEGAFSARITLRLPENLKSRIEDAATRDGVSVNTWVVHQLMRGAEPRRGGGGRRLTGFGQS